MNLGFLGVGNWAQKLATAFRECGAEIVAHDRGGEAEAPGFGTRSTVQAMIHGDICDALILCAPPEVTTEVALECAKAGKRCVATKPLMWTDYPELKRSECSSNRFFVVPAIANQPRPDLISSIYVDLWRLYSPAWIAMKEELQGKKIEHIGVSFCGNGPFRSFSGLLDYGPHAVAFVLDLLDADITVDRVRDITGVRAGTCLDVVGKRGDVPFRMQIGNGTKLAERSVCVRVAGEPREYVFDEPNEGAVGARQHRFRLFANKFTHAGCTEDSDVVVLQHAKPLALRRFCRAFMAGESSRTLEYSIAAQRVLERIIDGS